MKSTCNVKVSFEHSPRKYFRRFGVSSYEELQNHLRLSLQVPTLDGLAIQYCDEEGDWLTFDTSAEFDDFVMPLAQSFTEDASASAFRLRVVRCQSSELIASLTQSQIDRRSSRRAARRKRTRERRHLMRRALKRERTREGGVRMKVPMSQLASLFDTASIAHWNVTCDGCGKKNWVGARWKCQHPSCPNYDLCDQCFHHTNIHDRSHAFARVAARFPRMRMKRAPRNDLNDGPQVVQPRAVPRQVTAAASPSFLVPGPQPDDLPQPGIPYIPKDLWEAGPGPGEDGQEEESSSSSSGDDTDISIWQHHLEVLRGMGYDDEVKNVELLRTHSGDLNLVVPELELC